MPQVVTDPKKIVTDKVVLKELARQGIDPGYVEFFQDYAPRSQGKMRSPYAKFYRDLKTGQTVAVFSGLPMVKARGHKVEVGWLHAKEKYYSRANLFSAIVDGKQGQVTSLSDLSTGVKKGARVTWRSQLFLNGVEQSCGKAALLETDPTNENYQNNVLEWDFGICKRRLRLIEGALLGSWLFPRDPGGDVTIKYNQTGDFRLSLSPFKTGDDEEVIPRSIFTDPRLNYPFEISDTFFTSSSDGYVANSNAVWNTCRGAAVGSATGNVNAFYSVNSYLWAGLYGIGRLFFFFDTSIIDTATIHAAVASFYGTTAGGGAADQEDDGDPYSDVHLVEGSQADPLTTADFDAVGSVSGSESPQTYPWKQYDYNDFIMTAVARGWINPAGVTKLALRINSDFSKLTPTADGNYMNVRQQEAGAGYKPKLVVTFGLSVSQSPLTNALPTSITAHGVVDTLGRTPCTQKGHCWSTLPNPTTADDKTELGAAGTAPLTFASRVTGLVSTNVYYIRAYATDGDGTVYSEQAIFNARWVSATAIPFTAAGQIYFSPIIDNEVYVIDEGYNFYKYHMVTGVWTELASPNYSGQGVANIYRTLALSPDETKLACVSAGGIAGGGFPTTGAWRVEIYDIAGDSWAFSSYLPVFGVFGAAGAGCARAIVWKDNENLWVWAIERNGAAGGWGGKCIEYNIAGDSWTAYAGASETATINSNFGRGGAAIETDGSFVYMGGIFDDYRYEKYHPAGDTYAPGNLSPLTDNFAHAHDRRRLWYFEAAGTCQPGYVDVDTVTDNQLDDQFTENLARDAGYGKYFGLVTNPSAGIIVHARAAAPQLMSSGTFRALRTGIKGSPLLDQRMYQHVEKMER